MDLSHKRVLITRPRARADEFAAAMLSLGAQPIFFPVIEIRPPDDFAALDDALCHLERYDWLVLKSIHGVEAFFARLRALGRGSLPAGLRVAAVGPVTAARLAREGVTCDHVPEKYTAASILPGLWPLAGRRFLLPQSDLSRHKLAEAIRAEGGRVDEIIAYCTLPTRPGPQTLKDLRSGVDVICFASPSSVNSFLSELDQHELDAHNLPGNPLIACIGPVTASAALEAGLPVHIEAGEHTMDGLVTALKLA